MQIKVGRALVSFSVRQDENLYQDPHSGAWISEYLGLKEANGDRRWQRLGTCGSKEAAAKALYVERPGFTASYGS